MCGNDIGYSTKGKKLQKLKKFREGVGPYSPKLAPSDFHLFLQLKELGWD